MDNVFSVFDYADKYAKARSIELLYVYGVNPIGTFPSAYVKAQEKSLKYQRKQKNAEIIRQNRLKR